MLTVSKVQASQNWPIETEHDKGIATLWYNSKNMVKHAPKPFHLYIANRLNSTAGMNVVHNAMYSRNYAKYAEMAGINYTVYYTDYVGMTKDDAGTRKYTTNDGSVFNYRSNFGWATMHPGVPFEGMDSNGEQLLFICNAFGIKCDATPPPPPPPGPSPPSGPLPPSCIAELERVCKRSEYPTLPSCADCIRQNAGAEKNAGCGEGQGAFQHVVRAWCGK